MRPFSEASERNREPILAILKRVFRERKHVLEIGSGTGQHAAYFAQELPHLVGQASDAAFSANTGHIMSWPQVERMFEGIGKIPSLKTFCLYGPFSYGGKHTSASNARFDAMLRRHDPASGVRDRDELIALAGRNALKLDEDHAMPANNRLLVFQKELDE